MNQFCITLSILGIVVCTVPAQRGLAGSSHDARRWGLGITDTCVTCHTPDASRRGSEVAWNHATTTATFRMYGVTLQGTRTDPAPNKQSKLCLSCHDGVTAIDAYGGSRGTTTIRSTSPASNIGTDLRNDHPISILYDYNVTGRGSHGLRNPAGFTPGSGRAVPWLFDNKVECATCHDVHNTSDNPRLLRVRIENSDLCLRCHDM